MYDHAWNHSSLKCFNRNLTRCISSFAAGSSCFVALARDWVCIVIVGFEGFDDVVYKMSCREKMASHAASTKSSDSCNGVSEGRYINEGVIASSKTLPSPV